MKPAYVVLYRNPLDGVIGYVADGNGEMQQWDTKELAKRDAEHVFILTACPWWILEFDGLTATVMP